MDTIFSRENRPYISNRLRVRILLYLAIAIVLFGLMLYDTIIGEAAWWMTILAFVVGIVIGFFYGRLQRVRWHEDEGKVVRQNDIIGYILIAGYILLGVARDYLLGDLLTGAALIVVSLSVASGILLGRFWGMHISIMNVLREKRPAPPVM